MHVALNGWFWDQPYTGSGQYLRRLVGALRDLAPEMRLSLVVPAHIRALDDLPPDVDVLPMPEPLGGHPGKVWFEQRSFPHAVRRLRADVAHVPYWGPPLRIGAPLVTSVLDMIPVLLPEYRAGAMNRLYTGLVSAAARGSAHVLTISEASRQDITRCLDIPPERITVTPLAADERYRAQGERGADRAVREKYNLPDEFVLYLGSFVAHKNVRLLLAAYTFVAQAVGEAVPLVLAGHPPTVWGTARFPDLPATIDELGLDGVVEWTGPIDEADKPALYRLATVFVFPSRLEGFGLGPLEAMASGTPVVASGVSSIPEVTGDAAYLVAPDDSRAMGGAILSLLTDANFAADLRARGLERAAGFTWRRTAEGTLAVYRQVVEAGRAG